METDRDRRHGHDRLRLPRLPCDVLGVLDVLPIEPVEPVVSIIPNGAGLTHGVRHDQHDPFAIVAQSLIGSPRGACTPTTTETT